MKKQEIVENVLKEVINFKSSGCDETALPVLIDGFYIYAEIWSDEDEDDICIEFNLYKGPELVYGSINANYDNDNEIKNAIEILINYIYNNKEGDSTMKEQIKTIFRKLTEDEFKSLKEGNEVYVKIGNGYYKSHVLSSTFWNTDTEEPDWEVETTNGFCDNNSLYFKEAAIIKDNISEDTNQHDQNVDEFLEAVDQVCMMCTQDTLDDDEICENCPVRKSVDFYTKSTTTTEKEYLYSSFAYDHSETFEKNDFTCDDVFDFSTTFINLFIDSDEYRLNTSLLQAFYDYQEICFTGELEKYINRKEEK